MTAAFWENNTEDNINKGSPENPTIIFFLFIGLIVCGAIWVSNNIKNSNSSELYIVQPMDMTPAQIRIIEVISGHAWTQHGNDVNAAFDCLGRKGSTRAFKTFGFKDKNGQDIPTNLWMCLDDDGSWYTIVTTVFEKIGQDKVAKLITAYKVASDIFPTIDSYIQTIVEKWSAIEINYTINAEQIFLKPK